MWLICRDILGELDVNIWNLVLNSVKSSLQETYLLWQGLGQVCDDQKNLTADLQFMYTSLEYIMVNPVGVEGISDNWNLPSHFVKKVQKMATS